jgi:DNA polymerase-1
VSGELSGETLLNEVRSLLTDGKRLCTMDAKEQVKLLYPQGTYELSAGQRAQIDDVKLMAYLLNPLKNDYVYEDLAGEYLGRICPGYAELFGKQSIPQVLGDFTKQETFQTWLSAWLTTVYGAYEPMMQSLVEQEMQQLYEQMEQPLLFVLADMELEGIQADAGALHAYGEQLSGRIRELEQEIYAGAGEEFNINSPKQLGVILFEKLQMPYGKKTKTGYSTAADVLEKLAGDYPIVAQILEYRQLTKLKSTYADGLADCIRADGRIHSTFQQTITATGRISSTDPNLQNIPIRMELGRLIRKVFLPAENHVFLDADYSQIELRVLAHMSGDQTLIEAYRQAQDIHRITASQVFHIPFDEVTDIQRRNAKAVNFGIVYGISSFGLGEDLGISRKEAAEYIDQYFETYPKIKEFLDTMVADAKEKGYAKTMYGRRRPVPELTSGNFMQRSFGERVAMNSPIQGTAADIIKIAMIRVHDRLAAEGLSSRLILQVHDELLIETANEERQQVADILSQEMQHAADLAVMLEIDMHEGSSWYEAK